MPDPVKILAEIKAKGGEIETVEGAIVAGDAADINVVSMKGNKISKQNFIVELNIKNKGWDSFLASLAHLIFSEPDVKSRGECPPCESGTFCCISMLGTSKCAAVCFD